MEGWIRTLRRFARNKKAISGLETAIVLIAFVIVASAFAYAVLNMGFLATQKSQQVVLGGLQAASSAIVVDGPVYGYSNQTGVGANMTTLIFWLKTAAGATSVDLNVNKTTIGFQNPRGVWPNIYNTGTNAKNQTYTPTTGGSTYTATPKATTVTWEVGEGMLLKAGEKVRVTVDLYQIVTASHSAGQIMKNEQFVIIVKPPVGSVLDITRVAPAEVTEVNDLG
jgi:flagellin FlaB